MQNISDHLSRQGKSSMEGKYDFRQQNEISFYKKNILISNNRFISVSMCDLLKA
jgi:hypothetical protein